MKRSDVSWGVSLYVKIYITIYIASETRSLDIFIFVFTFVGFCLESKKDIDVNKLTELPLPKYHQLNACKIPCKRKQCAWFHARLDLVWSPILIGEKQLPDDPFCIYFRLKLEVWSNFPFSFGAMGEWSGILARNFVPKFFLWKNFGEEFGEYFFASFCRAVSAKLQPPWRGRRKQEFLDPFLVYF